MSIIQIKPPSWIPVLLLSLISFCSEENGNGPDIIENGDADNEPVIDEPISLAGVWRLFKTVVDDSCGISETGAIPQPVFIDDYAEYYQITDMATFTARCTLKADSLIIFMSEHVDGPGCQMSGEIIDIRLVSRDTIEATMITNISDDAIACDELIECTIVEDFLITRVKECNCPDRADFGNPKSSPYILPYRAGSTYLCTQSYCTPGGSHREQLHYDFDMQLGDKVIAARAGRVRTIMDYYPDDGYDYNYVYIEHADGTVAFYAHLMQNSVIVSVGDSVRQGQYFATSSESGSPGIPHLHFGVYQNMPPMHPLDVPVNFRNTDGPLDECGGLVRGARYRAKSIY